MSCPSYTQQCVTCRENHLKCDRTLPRCGRCVRSGRECQLAFKFKPSKGSFSRNQRWLRTPKKLIYVDETRFLTSGSPCDDISEYQFHIDETYNDSNESTTLETTPPVTYDSPHRTNSTQDSPGNYAIFSSAESMSTEPQSHEPVDDPKSASPFTLDSLHIANSPGNVFTSSFGSFAALPLRNRTEAILFRHYIQKLAVCLDLCDPLRHFELVVPERASCCNTLLNAILAISARHLSHTTDFDPLASNRYHDECLKYLIPIMNHQAAVSDENLFAATIILRMLEEMEGATSGQDNYSHLLGIHAFVNVGDQFMIPGSLSAASFWVGLRQEIYIAVTTQHPVRISLDHYVVDRSFEPADDYTWSNRAIVHLADVLEFCFGETAPTSNRWSVLNEASEKWSMARPLSFNPFFYKERAPPAAFPEVWHGSSCHVIGIQHHILAQLFLTQFDPSVPKVGPNRRAAIARTSIRIEALVRELCGIGISNQWTPPSVFTACMGIAMFGDQFGERSDQDAMMELLRKTEADHARPTLSIQKQLRRAWGWLPDTDD
ncbi:hypothetical protein F4778DRAFT_787361 [Xylariomycetidae sp. FL2044]|nr:hypothetical protein F4778DRAFT_787361 [Xylariomycetidae sp. FL2044]